MKTTINNCLKLVTLTAAISMALPASAKPFGQGGNCEPQGEAEGNAVGHQIGVRNCGTGKKPGFSLFDRIDADDDGLLSLQEVTDARFDRAVRHFLRLDTDSDGVISLEEYLAKGEKRKDYFEQYGDALVECLEETLGEPLPERTDDLTEEERFNEMDSNQDGVLDPDELIDILTNRIEENFTNKDIDGDGFLSEEEFQDAAEDRMARRKAIKECIDQLAEGEDILDELSGADIKTVAD